MWDSLIIMSPPLLAADAAPQIWRGKKAVADERAKQLAEASQAAEQRRREAEERVQPADARIAAGTAGYDGMEQDEEDGAKMVSTGVRNCGW